MFGALLRALYRGATQFTRGQEPYLTSQVSLTTVNPNFGKPFKYINSKF